MEDALYARRMQVYRKCISDPHSFDRWFEVDFAPTGLQYFPQKCPATRHYRVLSVGCGTGDRDVRLLQVLLNTLPSSYSVCFVGLEPNKVHSAEAQVTLSKLDPARMSVTIVPKRFEEVTNETLLATGARSQSGPYDLVLFMHTLYYFEDWKVALDRGIAMSEGNVIVLHQSAAGPCRPFSLVCHQMGHCGPEHMLTVAHMEEKLRRDNVAFTVHTLNTHLRVPAEPSVDSQEHLDILSFLAFANVDTRPEHKPVATELIKVLKLLAVDVGLQDGRLFLFRPDQIMIIPSPLKNKKAT